MRLNRAYRIAGVALLLAAACALPARAAAAVAIGQLPTGPTPLACTGSFDYVQPSVTGGTLYVAREAGTITSWSTDARSGGATYTFKIFRRTGDPDAFQAVVHASPYTVSRGLNTVPVDVQVRSGDMIGFHVSGPANSCTFPLTDDTVLRTSTDLEDGAFVPFSGVPNVRLNLQAVLVPSNTFTIVGLTRNRKHGTAILTVDLSNPGTVLTAGKGLKKPRSKNLFVAGSVVFPIAAKGKFRHRLGRTGKTTLRVNVTFSPIGGDPSTQQLAIKLKKRRQKAPRP